MKELITYDVAVKAFGKEPELALDGERAAFLGVWGLLIAEFESAVLDGQRRNRQMREERAKERTKRRYALIREYEGKGMGTRVAWERAMVEVPRIPEEII